MDKIIDNTSSLVNQYIDVVKQEITKKEQSNQPITLETISEIFEQVGNIFDGVSTEAQHKSFVKSNLPYVDPQKVELGTRLARKRKHSETTIYNKEETFMYVPLLDSLKQMLGNHKLAHLLLKKPFQCREGVFYDLFDGSFFKDDPYFSEHPNALILILYHDELEICNPLGSATGVHKIDMYYYCIANLPLKYRSRHCAVKLLAIANAALVKKYGIEKILSPIIEDLKKLYHGHEIEFDNGRNLTLYGKVLVCLGDNPGQNLWGGFKESCGGAYQKCRGCYCDFDSL
eukprot:TCONS_00070351-protein